MTKAAVAKSIDYKQWSDDTHRSWPEPETPVAPAWVTTAITHGWAVGEWLAISGENPTSGYGLTATNTIADAASVGTADDFQQSLIDSWTGGAYCYGHRSHGVFVMGPAGNHGGIGGTVFGAVMLFDLATRTWEEVCGPDSSGTSDTSEGFGEYISGRPIGNHSAWWPYYDSFRNEFAIPKGWQDPASGSDQWPTKWGHGLNLSSYDDDGYSDSLWRRFGQAVPVTGTVDSSGNVTGGDLRGLAAQAGGVWDSSRNCYWAMGAHNSFSDSGFVARYDSALDTWTAYSAQWCAFVYSAFAIDPVRDVLVMATNNLGGVLQCLDLANPDVRYQGATTTNALWSATEQGTPPSDYGQWGWEWSDAMGGFVQYDWNESQTNVRLASYVSGGSLQAGVQTDYTVAWSSLLAGTNAVTPPEPTAAGCFSKFRLAKWGDTEIAFFPPRADGAVYAFRVN